MRASTPVVNLYRLVLETATPLSIGAGRGDGVQDQLLAVDANGLPILPAASLAGVLRQAVASLDAAGPDAARELFGWADGNAGAASRLELSHGHVHDSRDQPAEGLLPSVEDELLRPLVEHKPQLRQRVRINHRGAADRTGLFNRSQLAAGHRFSVEMALWSAQRTPAEHGWLLAILGSGALRVGGLTRSGLGLMKVVRLHHREFDLADAAELLAWSALPRSLAHTEGLRPLALGKSHTLHRRAMLALAPEAGFRFGDGEASLLANAKPDAKPADDLPRSEARVEWQDGRARLSAPRPLVPAASIKGALAHRVAFHAERLARRWAAPGRADGYDKALHNDTVRRLFGHAGDETSDEPGQAGVLWLSDAWLQPEAVVAQRRMHNSIDRFTGGVRDGLLFTMEDLYAAAPGQPVLRLEIDIDMARARRLGATAQDFQALELTLQDLCRGRLALGADSAGGLGFFSGQLQWEGGGPPSQDPDQPAAARSAIQDKERSPA